MVAPDVARENLAASQRNGPGDVRRAAGMGFVPLRRRTHTADPYHNKGGSKQWDT